MDIQTWRARLGIFNSSSRHRASPHKKSSTALSCALSGLFKLLGFSWSLLQKLYDAFISVIILIIVLLHIWLCLCSHHLRNGNKRSTVQSLKLFLSPSMIFSVHFISLIVRALLLQSGSVESNPGPAPKLFSFCTWNVDSLLARDGIKKSYIECLQSSHDVDIFACCESYLNSTNQNVEDLQISGFSQIPFRSDCNQPGRAKGGVCLYYKESLPIKRRPDLELLDECICAEINRKKIIYIVSYRSPSHPSEVFDD